MEAKFQIFLIVLAVLAGTALLARRINVAPAILLLLAGTGLAFVPGMPSVELPPELVLLVVLPPLIYFASVAMSYDRSSVEAVVQHYFDALYEGDADKLGAIFHPSADLRWLEKGELQVLTVPDWLGRVRKRPSAKAEGKAREDFIVTIDRSDESTAFIKVRCQLPPRYFTDYLVAMKLADGWQIVSKSYRYDVRE